MGNKSSDLPMKQQKRFIDFYNDCILLAMEESNVFNLTRRELEILILLTQGLSSKQVASDLNISLDTVKDHRKSLLLKTSAKNCAELCYLTSKHNLF